MRLPTLIKPIDDHDRLVMRLMARAAFWTFCAIAVPACLLTTVAHFTSSPVLFAQLSPFRVQYAVLLGLFALGCLAMRRARWAALFGAFSLFNVAVVAAAVFRGGAESGPASAQATPLRVLFANVLTSNTDTAALLRLIEAEKPDLVALIEVDRRWRDELEASAVVAQAYPSRSYRTREDNFGIAVLSRRQPGDEHVVFFAGSEIPSLEFTLPSDFGPVRVLVTHPLPPGNADYVAQRDRHIAELAHWHAAGAASTAAEKSTDRALILADLNATPWCPPLRGLLSTSGLHAAAGAHKRIGGSWPATVSFLLIPLDHALLGRGLACSEFRVGPFIGSDHYPLLLSVVPAETGDIR